MPTYAKIRGDSMVMNPVAPAAAPNGSLFLDSSDTDKLKLKDTSGAVSPIESSTSLFAKVMQSGWPTAINAGTLVSKSNDGRIVPADSDSSGGQKPCGVALTTFSGINQLGTVHLFGPNMPGVLSSYSFVPGDDVYLSEVPGTFTNDPDSFTGDNDSIIKIGMADCPGGAASANAFDLIIMTDVILRP